MIVRMRVCLFGVMGHLTIVQRTVTGIQMNRMVELVKTVLSCMAENGTTIAARRSLATSVKDPKACISLKSVLGMVT